MAKEVKFTVKLNIDGKNVIVSAGRDARKFAEELGLAKTKTEELRGNLLHLNQLTQTFSNIGKGLQSLTGVINNLTEESNAFSTAMKAANTMAGKDAAGFNELKSDVADLAKNIPIARDQLANGLYQVISNGVPEDNWISYLEASSRAAVGGIADVGEVVKVTSTIIKNYGLDWSAAQEIQDKIQLTAKNGVTSFEQLAAALPRVTANAATLGVSIEELMATFATLTGVSGNTAEVSTQLGAIFTALIKPSTEAAKMASEMGVQFDAAAIKAAGGMQQFLSTLDKTIKQYAKSHGMLETEIYGRLFGSAESLRALIPITGELKDKFIENIGTMGNAAGTIDAAFEEMASTGDSKLQILKNSFAGVSDFIQATVGRMLPILNFSSQIGMSVVAVMSLRNAFVGLNVAQALSSNLISRNIAAYALFGTNSRKVAQAINIMSNASRSAATSALALKLAIRGLLVATGVGAAVVALGWAISSLISASNGASDAMEGTSKAAQSLANIEQQATQEAAEMQIQLDRQAERLKRLMDSHSDTSTAVGELNERYGHIFGTFNTAAEWYDTLISKSQSYCDQLRIEAEARLIGERRAQIRIDKYRNEQKGQRLIDSGGFGTNWFGFNNSATDAIIKEHKELVEEDEMLAKREKELQEEMADNQAMGGVVITGRKPITPATSPTAGKGKNKPPKKTNKTGSTEVTYLEGSIGYINKQIDELGKKRLTLVKEEDIRALDKVIERWKMLKEMKELAAASGKESSSSFVERALKFSTKDIDKQLKGIIPDLPPITIPVTANVKKATEALREIGKEEVLKAKAREAEKAEKKFQSATDSVVALGQGMSGIGKELGIPMLDVLGVLAQAIATMVRGYAEATAQAAEIGGPWGWIGFSALGLGQLATMISTVKSMATFADGGIVSGPTLGLVGEYAGARNNPEVIAPLNKLRSYLEPNNPLDGSQVLFRIDGRDLVGVLTKQNRYTNRA